MQKQLHKILLFIINLLLLVIIALVIKDQDQKIKINNTTSITENPPTDSGSLNLPENVVAPLVPTPATAIDASTTNPTVATPTAIIVTTPKAARTTKKS